MTAGIGYIRVSTGEQAEHGVSLDAQEARIRGYAAMAGIDLVGIIREEGVSASRTLATRPQGMQLVRAIAQGKATHIIALKLDRLFRDAVDALGQVRAWDKAGVALHLVDVGGQAIDTSTAMGRMFLTMMAGFAELERNLIAERTSAALQYKKAQGKAYGPTPYGLDRVGTHLVENPTEQAQVDRMQAMHADGASFRAIASMMNSEGIETKRGGRWHARTVAYITRNNLHAQGAERVAA